MINIKIDVIWPTHEAKTKIPRNPGNFLNNPGIKNKGKSRPGKSRDPGIWPNPVPENPGIENLDPARAWSRPMHPKDDGNATVQQPMAAETLVGWKWQ